MLILQVSIHVFMINRAFVPWTGIMSMSSNKDGNADKRQIPKVRQILILRLNKELEEV